MSGNHLKTPMALGLDRFANRKVNNEIQRQGKALPASVVSVSGSFVVVKFEMTTDPWTLPNLKVPTVGSEYIRAPIKAGCMGVVRPADARLGGVTGLGGGTADFSAVGNLSALVFEPLATTSFPEVDPTVLTMYGEPDVLIMDKTKAATLSVTSTGITATFGGFSVAITSVGVLINGHPYELHTHSGVSSGTSISGPVEPGT